MSGTERDDVETLADWLGAQVESSNVVDPSDEQTTWIEVQVDDLADRLIASDWLAQHDAAVAAKARAEALAPIRELADLWDERRAPNGRPMLTTANVVDRLRAALAAAEGDKA
ncbi:hypothetical protein [Nocardioides terrisoli]|uniref:hypothetical protein n=1 Tax=Nocardioides terrisoli TaxID=3388267 RepID=UPI00287B79BE|nr:hypothetical protein [Nocardioides marmorisolisilvae]